MSTERPSYLEKASRFICDTQLADLGSAVRDRGRWIIADCIPVIAAGMRAAEMEALVSRHLENAAPGNAWVIGTGRRAAALDAALLNGTAGTWLELDEGNLFAKGHPGIQVVPAALSVAQEMGASGADLLLAVTLGYEISARISRAANVRMSVHPHGTYGVIGAAIAVGKLKKLNPPQMRELLNVAATMGMATSRMTLLEGSTVRNIYTGHSGYMGQMAVRLVEAGFTGEPDGVGSVYGGGVLSEKLDRDGVAAQLGEEWLITKSYFKLHCAGRYAHSAIDALEDALAKTPGGRIEPSRIERIDVDAYSLVALLGGKNITTSFGARFSVPFALASILYHGKSGLSSFDEQAVANPTVQSLVSRVYVTENPSYTAAFPEKQFCDVAISLTDGTVITGRCEVT
ncbi:MAG TPA: MmgE/PrpD family protein, partial [Burkholderiales bacterium]|nr:MmgE/PrpD family protein [Burkholderiales bacterium]